MKLEEKFNKTFRHFFCGMEYYIDKATKQCAEITEQECIGFAEWIDKSDLISDSDTGEWISIVNGDTLLNTKELFKLYLKSKEDE